MQASLDLAEVWVGQLGSLGELAERQVGQLALAPDEGAERFHLRVPGFVHRSPLPNESELWRSRIAAWRAAASSSPPRTGNRRTGFTSRWSWAWWPEPGRWC